MHKFDRTLAVMAWACGLCIIAVLGIFAIGIYKLTTADTFELPEDEWHCVKHSRQTTYYTYMAGKTPITQPMEYQQCDIYARRP